MNKNWKQDLVLIAKNTFVWMYQLSEKYGRQIQHLDQIPFEELMELRSNGINGLWLIGIWERSPASRKIKELYGKQDCIASAYSISEYKITDNLGGESAFNNLKEKAHDAGIKLGCDIVPNHTGIDAPWVIDHPNWYIQADRNPSSDFRFNSPNLSSDPRAEIRLEEGYFNQTGAAEVFQFRENQSEKNIFIYHGNDGTSMPWNDTAQLNYLIPETRTAVRELIVEVAKHFDIIRFDAAMTLTKQHYKRLWFPTKGDGKYIPTRGGNNLDELEFDKIMPKEFWTEVMDDIRQYAPDTLLIAEAFWLMEGFFVNKLGMDRVYNSAFMNLLRDEENKEFKGFIRDVCSWDPYFMEHLVNYQSTPDEEPAINQFGEKEKYLGVCTLLATFPGMPMFGHGQIEGYRERYGMDFIQPRFREAPSDEMIVIHQSKIKPLLDIRHKFAGSNNFQLYDYLLSDESIANDVIAFSNNNDNYLSLIIFNNSKNQLEGYIENPFHNIIKDSFELIDFFTKEEIKISDAIKGSHSIFLPISPYECRVFEVKAY
ncbi:MAG: alpha-amylase family glycosyl hydrolase [Pelolinea sp.]|nr:alpha-amylase family glycosyl hydrolase [Pelolinea sp.]